MWTLVSQAWTWPKSAVPRHRVQGGPRYGRGTSTARIRQELVKRLPDADSSVYSRGETPALAAESEGYTWRETPLALRGAILESFTSQKVTR